MLLPAREAKAHEASLFPPTFATVGLGGASARHAHHAMHLVVAREGTLRITADAGEWDAPAFVTAPDVAHAIFAEGKRVVLVFVDPESDEGERLARGLVAVRTFDAEARDRWLASLPHDTSSRGAFDAWVRAIVTDAAASTADDVPVRPRAHPRVRKLVRYLRTAPADADTSIAALALHVGLSESRLGHAFRASVGIPLRAYLLWQKLQRAVVAMASGMPLAHAAAEGGFADAAHMSRTFRRMFGMSASALRGGLAPARAAERARVRG